MSEHKLRHRHAVFLPLFILTLSFSAFPQNIEVAKAKITSLLGESQFGDPFVLEDGTYGVVEQGGVLSFKTGVALEKGSVVLGHDGLFEATVGSMQLSGLSGEFHIIRGTKNITVSALTTPVLVRLGEERVLIPVGYQWSRGKEGKLPNLGDGFEAWSNARSFRLLPGHFIRDSLKKVRRTESITTASGGILSGIVSPMEQFNALSELMPHEAAWMLASVHPEFRAQAWTLSEDGYATEAQLVRLLSFPYLDGSTDTVESFAFDRWSETVKEAAFTVELPDKFLERFFRAHFPLVKQMRERGYPERADLLAQHLRTLLEGWQNALPPELEGILVNLQREQNVAVHQEVENVREFASASSIPTLDPEAARKSAYALLHDAGALFTVETTVEPTEGNSVHVGNVLFGGTSEDRMVSFTLDVEQKTVSTVELEKKSYPFQLEWSAFVEWIRK